MPVYLKLKTAFIRVPKTASSSIASALHFNSCVKNGIIMHPKRIRQHATAEDIRGVIGKEVFDSLFKFAFVRNPWDRVSSFYFSYMNSGAEYRLSRKTENSIFMEKAYNNAVDNKNSNFESWLINIKKAYDSGLNINKFDAKYISEYCPIGAPIPQLNFVMNRDKKVIVDYIGRYENLDDDWSSICEKLGLKAVKLGRFNSRNDNDYKKNYNKKLIEIIGDIYREEIEFFGYKY